MKVTKFGDPILRTPARRLTKAEILSPKIQQLITEMRKWLQSKPKFGVGLAAPQIGQSVALSVIEIKPTPYRPNVKAESLAIINPEIIKTYDRRTGLWEGCISYGGSQDDFPYAKALRYKKVRLRYLDEQGQEQERDFEGMMAHVIQHETDHLNGVLFVDRVRDTKTYMMKSEYVKQYGKKK